MKLMKALFLAAIMLFAFSPAYAENISIKAGSRCRSVLAGRRQRHSSSSRREVYHACARSGARSREQAGSRRTNRLDSGGKGARRRLYDLRHKPSFDGPRKALRVKMSPSIWTISPMSAISRSIRSSGSSIKTASSKTRTPSSNTQNRIRKTRRCRRRPSEQRSASASDQLESARNGMQLYSLQRLRPGDHGADGRSGSNSVDDVKLSHIAHRIWKARPYRDVL